MKPSPFRYVRIGSLDHLFDAFEEYGGEAQILAGGQSLMPLLNMRLAAPAALLDINGLAELAGIAVDGGILRIGALTRHREIEASPVIRRHAPLLAAAMPHIAHVAIRNRGTFGGSIALADPAAELPACCLALGASFALASRRGMRRVRADDFFQGLYRTALAPDEVLLAAEIPVAGAADRHGFRELARRHGDYALAGLAARARAEEDRLPDVRLAFFGVADRPVLARRAASILESGPIDAALVEQAQHALTDDIDPPADFHADAATRLHLARVLLRRALPDLIGRGPA